MDKLGSQTKFHKRELGWLHVSQNAIQIFLFPGELKLVETSRAVLATR